MSKSKEFHYLGDLEKDKQCVELSLLVDVVTHISCSKCSYADEFNGDTFDCIDSIYNNGWRVVKDQILCPGCSNIKVIEYD